MLPESFSKEANEVGTDCRGPGPGRAETGDGEKAGKMGEVVWVCPWGCDRNENDGGDHCCDN